MQARDFKLFPTSPTQSPTKKRKATTALNDPVVSKKPKSVLKVKEEKTADIHVQIAIKEAEIERVSRIIHNEFSKLNIDEKDAYQINILLATELAEQVDLLPHGVLCNEIAANFMGHAKSFCDTSEHELLDEILKEVKETYCSKGGEKFRAQIAKAYREDQSMHDLPTNNKERMLAILKDHFIPELFSIFPDNAINLLRVIFRKIETSDANLMTVFQNVVEQLDNNAMSDEDDCYEKCSRRI